METYKRKIDQKFIDINEVWDDSELKTLEQIIKEFDPGPTFSYEFRFLTCYTAMYKLYMAHRELQVRRCIEKLIGSVDVINMTDEQHQMLKSIYKSSDQRSKSPAGRSIEELAYYFFQEANLNCETQANGGEVDVALYPNVYHRRKVQKKSGKEIPRILRTSCKHSMRDRVNDKADEIQMNYLGEVSDRYLQEFSKSKSILIIIEPESRKKVQSKVDKLGLKLKVHSLDEGMKIIKQLCGVRNLKEK